MKLLYFTVVSSGLLAVVFGQVVFKNDESSSSNPSSKSYTGAGSATGNSSRDGRNLLHWIHSFTNPETDPYLAKANTACLDGDLAECFKAKALSNLDEFFTKESYSLNDNARIVRMPEEHVRRVYQEPFEFTTTGARADEPEWDQFVKFVTRKVERFLKSAAVEVQFSDDVTESGRYSPRFIDEITSELDAIEDKKGGLLSKCSLLRLTNTTMLQCTARQISTTFQCGEKNFRVNFYNLSGKTETIQDIL